MKKKKKTIKGTEKRNVSFDIRIILCDESATFADKSCFLIHARFRLIKEDINKQMREKESTVRA